MKQLFLTINNLMEMHIYSIKLFKFLYYECDVPIRRIREPDRGYFEWDNDQKTPLKICISRKMTKIEAITTLLHEVGHLKDFKKLREKFKPMPQKKCEKSAWKHAVRFSRDYNMEIDGKLAMRWLSTYQAKYKCLENLAARQSPRLTTKVDN